MIQNKYNYQPLNSTWNEFRLHQEAIASSTSNTSSLDLSDIFPQRAEPYIDELGIGHVFIQGFIGQKLSNFEKQLGATDVADVLAEVNELSKNVRKIMLHIDSGGGMAAGSTELANELLNMDAQIYTYTDGIMASAAYNIGVVGRTIAATPSATIGSIGTIIPFVDESGFWQAMGINFQPITNKEGDLKGAGMGPSLTESQRESLQEQVQEHFEMFKSNVLSQRAIADEDMRGQTFVANSGLQKNFVDIVTDVRNFTDIVAKT